MSNYDMEMQNLKCECSVDESVIKIGSLEGSKTLYKSFYDVLKYSNYKVLFCYKLAFRLINFKINIGCILICIFFAIYLIFLFSYIYKGYKIFKLDIAKYMFIDKIQKTIKLDSKEPTYINSFEKIKQDKKRKTAFQIKSDYSNIINGSTSKTVNRKSVRVNHRKSNKSVNFPPKKSSIKTLELKSSVNDNKEEKPKNKHNKKVSINVKESIYDNRKISSDSLISNIDIEKLDNYELNDLDYDSALKLDQRNFIKIYWALLKREQLIIFTFFIRNDHNIVFLKVIRLIFLLCTDMTTNVFFFADETMHKMYLDYGKYKYIQTNSSDYLFYSCSTNN